MACRHFPARYRNLEPVVGRWRSRNEVRNLRRIARLTALADRSERHPSDEEVSDVAARKPCIVAGSALPNG
jgi:hypothetical protein